MAIPLLQVSSAPALTRLYSHSSRPPWSFESGLIFPRPSEVSKNLRRSLTSCHFHDRCPDFLPARQVAMLAPYGADFPTAPLICRRASGGSANPQLSPPIIPLLPPNNKLLLLPVSAGCGGGPCCGCHSRGFAEGEQRAIQLTHHKRLPMAGKETNH